MVIGFADKYRFDPFLRAQVNTIGLQAVFAVLILVVVGISFTYLYKEITLTLIQKIRENILLGTGAGDPEIILHELESIKTKNLTVITGSIVFMTVIFGYIIGRITLSPARNALKSQKQFIGNIAHELRTPLSIVKTNTEVTLLDDTIDPKIKHVLKSNVEELNRASEIINNLLSFNSFIRPEQVKFENVDLGKIIESVVHDLLPLADRKHIEIVMRRASRRGDYSTVWGNPTALDQIVRNLLKNSINYTPHDGSIHITTEPYDNLHVRLSVEDTGIGIARKDLFRIFEPFYRVDRSRSREHGGGSGLGLAIVSELVKLHHGKIVMRSTPGRGTNAIVLLHAGEHPAVEDPRRKDDLGFNEVSVDFSARKGAQKNMSVVQGNLL
ncbi:MAG: hypothetical protein A2408_00365 [Candidatus Yonathbacteria bacterium RIFOXYC1_FULL_52_10]|nr:MAG: hypothetical protein A2408_00365 [Candidatus Yonathbacteria bacterium RIFOXYC1_FULL_52_10]